MTRQCPCCGGGPARRETRPWMVRRGTASVEIQLPGWWCDSCGEVVLDPADVAIADEAFRCLPAANKPSDSGPTN